LKVSGVCAPSDKTNPIPIPMMRRTESLGMIIA
jgi:hypothetical protein